jgi:putative addiction module killer protein
MYDIKQTERFSKWLLKLKDLQGKIAIARRVERMRKGNFGDHKSVGENVSELLVYPFVVKIYPHLPKE